MLKPFGFSMNLHGVTVMPDRVPLHDACLSNAQVDIEILGLKIDLDRVAKAMKAVIAEKRIIPFVRKPDA